jgi:galactose mutarotase-like enzyme
MKRTFEEISMLSGSTQVQISPERGGLVTSFNVDNTEILYLDRETFNDITKNVRGGIPLLFPNAGPLKDGLYHLPQHGFARTMPWTIIAHNDNSITLQLLSNEETRGTYPFDFELILKVEAANNQLIHDLTVKNTSDKPMPTAYGTHPYFEIPQEEKQRLITNIRNFNPSEINWMGEFDKPFLNPGLIKIQMPRKEIAIESDLNVFRFARIWHQAGKDFICIEPWTRDNFALNNPNQSLWIKPSESITLSITMCVKIVK